MPIVRAPMLAGPSYTPPFPVSGARPKFIRRRRAGSAVVFSGGGGGGAEGGESSDAGADSGTDWARRCSAPDGSGARRCGPAAAAVAAAPPAAFFLRGAASAAPVAAPLPASDGDGCARCGANAGELWRLRAALQASQAREAALGALLDEKRASEGRLQALCNELSLAVAMAELRPTAPPSAQPPTQPSTQPSTPVRGPDAPPAVCGEAMFAFGGGLEGGAGAVASRSPALGPCGRHSRRASLMRRVEAPQPAVATAVGGAFGGAARLSGVPCSPGAGPVSPSAGGASGPSAPSMEELLSIGLKRLRIDSVDDGDNDLSDESPYLSP